MSALAERAPSDQSASVAVVTGAASGIGRACVTRFVSEGWQVAALDIDAAGLEYLNRDHPSILACPCDVTKASQVDTVLTSVANWLGDPAVCVNAAGIYPPTELATVTEAEYRRIVDLNVWGTICVSRRCAEAMRRTRRGAIVNIASDAAFQGCRDQLVYAASKAAVVSLTKSMALDLVEAGVRVNAIAPGWVRTEGTERGGRIEAGIASVPMGRAAVPEEIADLAWWLCQGHGAAYITGETIVSAGGLFMR